MQLDIPDIGIVFVEAILVGVGIVQIGFFPLRCGVDGAVLDKGVRINGIGKKADFQGLDQRDPGKDPMGFLNAKGGLGSRDGIRGERLLAAAGGQQEGEQKGQAERLVS